MDQQKVAFTAAASKWGPRVRASNLFEYLSYELGSPLVKVTNGQ